MKPFFALLTVMLAACSAPPEPPPPAVSAQVQTATVREMPMTQTLAAYGVAEFDPASTRTLVVQFEAQVVSLEVAAGQNVHKGQALLTLKPGAAAQLELQRLAREDVATANELERLTRMRGDGLATNAEVQAAQLAAASAHQMHASLAARSGGGQLLLRAPAEGVVDALPFAPGDVVPAGSMVARLGAANRLRVRLGIEPEDLVQVHAGASVRLHALQTGAVIISGRISAVDGRVDPQARLAGALVTLPAGAGFMPGEALRAQIVLAQRGKTLAVPRSAVLYDPAHADQPYVYLASAGKAQRRNVTVGLDDGHDIEIASGLTLNEVVVVQGNYELADGMNIQTVSAPAGGGSAQ
jgi:membrane fusion protein (multidrug efflux system)